jgi:hypothetical protein
MPQIKDDQLIAEAYDNSIALGKHNSHPPYGPGDADTDGKVWAEITIQEKPGITSKTVIAIDPKLDLNKQVYSKFPHAQGYKLGTFGKAFHQRGKEMGSGEFGSLD